MNEKIRILWIILGVQLALTVGLMFTGSDGRANLSVRKLVPLEFDSLNRISIAQPEKLTLVLEKSEKGWVMPGYHGFPVSSSRVQRVIGGLLDETAGWPVATTQSAQKRFKVTEKEFERRLVLEATGDRRSTLLLGTSPGFKKIHARLDGQPEIYSIRFNAYEAGENPMDWADSSYLHLKADTLNAVELPGLTVHRKDDAFSAEGLADNEEIDDLQARTLFSSVAGVSFQEVLGDSDKPEYTRSGPAFEFTAVTGADQRVVYTFFAAAEGEGFVLKASNRPYYFRVSQGIVDGLKKYDRKMLVVPKMPVPAEPPAEVPGSADPPDGAGTEPVAVPDGGAPDGR